MNYPKMPALEIIEFLANREESKRNKFLELGYDPNSYSEYAKTNQNPIANMLEQEAVIGEFEDSRKIDKLTANVFYALNRVAYLADMAFGVLSSTNLAEAIIKECKVKYDLAMKFMPKSIPTELSGYQTRAQDLLSNLELALGKGGLE